MTERTAMAEEDRRLQREGVPPEVAGPRAYRKLRLCGCQERPAPGSEWEKRWHAKRRIKPSTTTGATASNPMPDTRDSSARRADWSPLEHVPSDEVLSKLVDVAERRWTAERFERDHDVRALSDWLWDDEARTEEGKAASAIKAANSLAYALGRNRPVVVIPHGARPTVSFVAPLELPGGIMALGVRPVREAIRDGARTVDALLTDHQVREGLDHESQRFCYRGWLAGEGRRKPETEDTRRAMATLLLEVVTRPLTADDVEPAAVNEG